MQLNLIKSFSWWFIYITKSFFIVAYQHIISHFQIEFFFVSFLWNCVILYLSLLFLSLFLFFLFFFHFLVFILVLNIKVNVFYTILSMKSIDEYWKINVFMWFCDKKICKRRKKKKMFFLQIERRAKEWKKKLNAKNK